MKERDRKLLLQYIENIIPYSPVNTLDEGFGTAYERQVINKWFETLIQKYRIQTVLEFPCDGITGLLGINSLIFTQKNCDATLCNMSKNLLALSKRIWHALGQTSVDMILTSEDRCLPFPDNTFDLVWNFCMMERYGDPHDLVREMKRVSKRLVLIMTQNWSNWGTAPHKFYHSYKKKPWDHGYKKYMTFEGIRSMIKANNLKTLEEGGMDAPPIIDTWDTPIRGTLQSILKSMKMQWKWKAKTKTPEQQNSGLLKLFSSLEENLPEWFKRCQAHHLYVLAEKISPS